MEIFRYSTISHLYLIILKKQRSVLTTQRDIRKRPTLDPQQKVHESPEA